MQFDRPLKYIWKWQKLWSKNWILGRLFARCICMGVHGFSDEYRHSFRMTYWQKRFCNGYLHHHHSQINAIFSLSVVLKHRIIYFRWNRLSIENLCFVISSFNKCKMKLSDAINSFGGVIFYSLSSIHSCQDVLSIGFPQKSQALEQKHAQTQ